MFYVFVPNRFQIAAGLAMMRSVRVLRTDSRTHVVIIWLFVSLLWKGFRQQICFAGHFWAAGRVVPNVLAHSALHWAWDVSLPALVAMKLR